MAQAESENPRTARGGGPAACFFALRAETLRLWFPYFPSGQTPRLRIKRVPSLPAVGRHLFRTVSLLKRQAHAYALRATAGRQECLPHQRRLGGAVDALGFEDQLTRQVAEQQPFHAYRLIHQQAGDVEGQVIELSH